MSHTKPLTFGGIGATPGLDEVVSVARGHQIALDAAGSERIKKESPPPKSFEPESASAQQPAAAAVTNSSSSSPWPVCLSHVQARAVLITRLMSLMSGKSGVRLQLIDFIKELLNSNMVPTLPATHDKGVLNALADACKGEGCCSAAEPVNATAAPTSLASALEAAGISPPSISATERAVLSSSASAAAGVSSLAVVAGRQLLTAVTAVCALSCEAAGAQVRDVPR